jgi:formylglycine-generating enzyme required for sulfatase activity
MKAIFKKSVTLVIVLFFCSKIFANGITISNVVLLPITNQIQFDVSWENSWRSDVLQNWDAAWIFAKFKNQSGNWQDIRFTNTNSFIPSGYSKYIDSNSIGLGWGAFLFKSAAGSGNSTILGVKFTMENSVNPINGIPALNISNGGFDVKVFGIEMVYIPEGSFFSGDNVSDNAFKPKVGSPGNFTAKLINKPKLENLADLNGGTTDFDPITAPAHLNAVGSNYPTGYKAFYCMKYEISQGGYRDFLNTLNITQQANHIAVSPTTSAPGTVALTASITNNNIKIITSGVAATSPAVFGCDANNNGIYNEAADGEWKACNYLTWPDVAAYLMWSGLNVMTELQYEKACRGPLLPVAGEYAWGNTTLNTGSLITLNGNQANEGITNASTTLGNAAYSNSNLTIPVRNGIFATATSNRVTSGGSFYGVMEMSGNLTERVVTLSKIEGIGFQGSIGFGIEGLNLTSGYSLDGTLPGAGSGNFVDGSRPALGLMYRGGSIANSQLDLRVSDRFNFITTADIIRVNYLGGRGVYNFFQ